MNTDNPFIHELTPDCLLQNSADIWALLCADELETETLLTLITNRDSLIVKYLTTLDDACKKSYVNKELVINDRLLERAKSLQEKQKNLLIDLVRRQNAVKQYR